MGNWQLRTAVGNVLYDRLNPSGENTKMHPIPLFRSRDNIILTGTKDRAWSKFDELRSNHLLIPQYHTERKKIICDSYEKYKSMGNGYARQLRTSGYTNGKHKFYTWGPKFGLFSWFFDDLRVYGKKYDNVIYLSKSVKANELHFSYIPWDMPYKYKIMIISPNNTNMAHDEIKQQDKSNTIIWSYPSNIETIESFGFDLSVFSGFTIYLSGEKLSEDLRRRLRDAGADVRDSMRCWDSGATMFTCPCGERHWCDLLADHRINEKGILESYDLYNFSMRPGWRSTGDKVVWERDGFCRCGLPIDHIEFDDRKQVVKMDGCNLNYRTLFTLFSSCIENKQDKYMEMDVKIRVDVDKKVIMILYASNGFLEVSESILNKKINRLFNMNNITVILYKISDIGIDTFNKDIPISYFSYEGDVFRPISSFSYEGDVFRPI